MIPKLIMLINRSFGIRPPKNGISKESFEYTQINPIFESCQGATKLVVDWVLTSSIIQNIHQDTVQGSTFESVDGKIKVSKLTVCVVDDNNNCLNKEGGDRPVDEKLQESAAHNWRNAGVKQVHCVLNEVGTR